MRINEMAKQAYPKIIYCQEAYEKGANDILDVVSKLCENMPPFYRRYIAEKISNLRGSK